jgi:predicted nucleic acid-binding protein
VTIDRTADTSVVVPALTDWHEHHRQARSAIEGVQRLPAPVLVESYSVLTRLPRGLALSPVDAKKVLCGAFPDAPLTLDPAGYRALLELVAPGGLRGGAVYDALVGWTAAQAGVELLTRDARASGAYRAVGVRFRAVV